MSNFYIEAEGLSELMARVEKVASQEAVAQTTKSFLKECGKITQARAKDLAPRSEEHQNSGVKHKGQIRLVPPLHMDDAIPLSGVKGTNKSNMYIVVGWQKDDNSPYVYGKFIEYGTSKMPPRPFMENALQQTQGQFDEIGQMKYEELVKGID